MNYKEHTFIVMWDMYGLEYLADITADNQRVTWEKLQGKESPKHAYANPLHLKLRAQYNTQRHYEIYLFNAAEGITTEDIQSMFEADPQSAADTIRRIGHCYHSDRAPEDHKIAIR
jgi:hypothetical protein